MRSLTVMRVALAAGLAAMLLAACIEETPTPESFTPTPSQPAVTPTAAVTPTPVRVAAPLDFVTFRHKSGVFSLSQPSDWEAIDSSTDRRLLVRFLPPPGFGSRVTVEVTNEGVLTRDQLHQKAESFIALNYASNPAYRESTRSDLPDGRFQVVYAYDDGRGGAGAETLTFQQVGPFLIVTGIFVSDPDRDALSSVLDKMASSLIVDPQAAWGTSVAAINPAELLVANTYLWQSGTTTYYMGEIYNASPAAVTNIKVQITLCDKDGVALAPLTAPAALKVLEQGGTIPFMVSAEQMPRGIKVCSEQASAEPARPDPSYTTGLGLEVKSSINQRGRLVIDGQAVNPGLLPVKDIHVVIAVYNAENKVVGYVSLTSDPDLLVAPGQAWPISAVFESLGGKADHFVTLGEAQVVPPSNPSLNP